MRALLRSLTTIIAGTGTSDSINPRHYQPQLPLPPELTKEQVLESLISLSIDGSTKGELTAYANADCERFLYTLGLISDTATGKLLEIGANPYFTTVLLRHFRPRLELTLTNYFGPPSSQEDRVQKLNYTGFNNAPNEVELRYKNINCEFDRLPYCDDSFEFILFCEVLEHMTNDPLHVLLELKRVLKHDGQLILTTPNAARLENVIAFIEGRNIYDPYSGYGPYGRHNREYTRHELHMLMEHCGFKNEASFTANVHEDIPGSISGKTLETLLQALKNREHDLGQYLFTRWRNTSQANSKKPTWLYRSYSSDQMA